MLDVGFEPGQVALREDHQLVSLAGGRVCRSEFKYRKPTELRRMLGLF